MPPTNAYGLIDLVKSGIRFWATLAATKSVTIKPSATEPATDLVITMLTALPASGTEAVTLSSTGQLGTAAISGGGGTVTSVAASAPSDLLAVSGSPVTTSGTITLSKVSQSANLFYGSPNGSAGNPTFRSLVAADIPSLTSAKISDFDTQVRTSTLNQLAAPTTSLNLNSQRIIALADPSGSQDAATKQYVDSIASTGNNKGTVRVASTANITVSNPGTATFDGVTLTTGDLILLKNQSTGSENGIYVFNGSGSALTRATNADTSAEVKAGLFVFVSEGTVNGDNGFTLTTNDPITLGSTALVFTQTSGAGQIIDGAALTKTGNQLDVNVDNSTIEVATDALRVKDLGITNAKIANNTIDLTTKVTGALPVASGGTGGTTAATARSGISAAGVFGTTFTSSNVTAGILTVTHNLGRQVVHVTIADNNNLRIGAPDQITYTSTNALNIDLTSFGTISGTWTVTVVG